MLFIQHCFITWNQNRPLKFEDFKYTPQKEQEYSALTASKLYFDHTINNDSIKYNIYYYFMCDSSWICCHDSILLAHEQGHFDISEIYARMLRKKTIELINKYSSLDSIQYYINSLFESIDIDDVYDTETNHGTITTENERWKNKIDKMLDSLKDYDKPIGTISIK
jgi:hypothetical protein